MTTKNCCQACRKRAAAKGFRIYLLGKDRIDHIASWHQIQNEEQFGEDLFFAASRIPQEDLRVGLLGDGADWLWKHMVACFPEGRPILDYFHCAEHIHKVANVQYKARNHKNVLNGWKVQ